MILLRINIIHQHTINMPQPRKPILPKIQLHALSIPEPTPPLHRIPSLRSLQPRTQAKPSCLLHPNHQQLGPDPSTLVHRMDNQNLQDYAISLTHVHKPQQQ